LRPIGHAERIAGVASAHAALRLKNRLSELERLGQFIAEFGAEHGLATKAISELQLAIDELVTNVISYAYADAGEHGIDVRLTADGGEVTVEVEDDGQPFDPLTAPEPDVDAPIEARQIGGLGIHLVRQVTDRLEYRRVGGKNVVDVHKNAAKSR
jgi:serine/threonine-protein kinase RsbW